jgi:hypothetical protein
MTKLFLGLSLLFATSAMASEIQMYENNAPLPKTSVERVVVQGPEVYVRSAIHPCSSYPGFPEKIYGDVYECFTSRENLSKFLNDQNVKSLSDADLSKYIVSLKQTFSCANRNTPELVPYFGKNVYWFSGILLTTSASR